MERYHFNLQNGEVYPDEEGAELKDLDAARDEALKVLAQSLTTNAAGFWETQCLALTVTDDCGLTLFRLTTSAHDAPSVGRPKR